MQPDQKLFTKIINILSPHMDGDDRLSLITQAFFGHNSLLSRINWSGNSKAFTTRLVAQLVRYGGMESGEKALTLLLKTLQDEVGLEGKREIEEILDELKTLDSSSLNKTTTEYSQPKIGKPWTYRRISIVMSYSSFR